MSFTLKRGLSALFVLGCFTACDNSIPKYWSDLGVSAKGVEMLKDPSDQFLVLIYTGAKADALIDVCTKAYAPIVAAGFTPAIPVPAGSEIEVEQNLSRLNEKISISCKALDSGVFVTFRHR